MTKKVVRVKVYSDIALITGRGQNTGTWQGQPMKTDEWIMDVYKREMALCSYTFSALKK